VAGSDEDMEEMAAESLGYDSDQPKRRRRKGLRGRARPRAPISARLMLNSQLRGDVGVLSDDLVNDLFPWLAGELISTGKIKMLWLNRG
jgi:hypothetical protein